MMCMPLVIALQLINVKSWYEKPLPVRPVRKYVAYLTLECFLITWSCLVILSKAGLLNCIVCFLMGHGWKLEIRVDHIYIVIHF